MRKQIFWLLITSLCLSFVSCREDSDIFPPDSTDIPDSTDTDVIGFYLLNEGSMGSNKSTLDYIDFKASKYNRNIYASVNSAVPKELGDVGNDLKIYGSKLYAVINCSNKVEVMNARTAERLGQINIPNCRFICFHKGYAYVTSYVGQQNGYVAKVDIATFQVIDTCWVGFQPDELEVVGNKIYVANSGGYRNPNDENTVSVIDIDKFKEIKRIKVAINLYHLKADRFGNLWVSSNGNYKDTCLYWIDTKTDTCGGQIDIPVSNFWLDGDSLYIIYSNFSMNNSFSIVDVAQKKIVTHNFITDGSENQILTPYGIMVHPITKDIYLTDAVNYVDSGLLLCFNRQGKKKWQVQTGDIPAHFAILYK